MFLRPCVSVCIWYAIAFFSPSSSGCKKYFNLVYFYKLTTKRSRTSAHHLNFISLTDVQRKYYARQNNDCEIKTHSVLYHGKEFHSQYCVGVRNVKSRIPKTMAAATISTIWTLSLYNNIYLRFFTISIVLIMIFCYCQLKSTAIFLIIFIHFL